MMRAVPIIRSRTGCFTCRRRKKKCNEEKPVCIGCKRNKLECKWPAEVADTSTAAVPATRESPKSEAHASRRESLVNGRDEQQQQQQQMRARRPSDGSSDAMSRASSGGSSSSSSSHDTPRNELDHEPSPTPPAAASSPPSPLDTCPDKTGAQRSACSSVALLPRQDHGFGSGPGPGSGADSNIYMHDNIPINMSLLPSHGHDSFELLGYYLARTANSMGNGSTDVNPFVAKFIPLAFSDPLVLHLILAQSAVHRQSSKECASGGEVATRYYTDSLRMFRNLVGEYVSGKESTNLVVTVGSLILCLTEVARGDARGTIFDHLAASKALLTSLLGRRPSTHFSDDLTEFLVEYYMHMVASSMISKDARGAAQPALGPAIEDAAQELLRKNYTGQLCGCWLEILTLIPQVFQLGQSMLRASEPLSSSSSSSTPSPSLSPSSPLLSVEPASPDDIITFGLLQAQILNFVPSATASPSSQLAGLVFKQATLLYLWSIFGTPAGPSTRAPGHSMHGDLVDGAVLEAVALLNQLPASERVNTSLCWPLTVVGCCTRSPDVQHMLRTRLRAMIDTIGLGNMRQTLTLLEHVWAAGNVSPWTLRDVMRREEIWISFA